MERKLIHDLNSILANYSFAETSSLIQALEKHRVEKPEQDIPRELLIASVQVLERKPYKEVADILFRIISILKENQ